MLSFSFAQPVVKGIRGKIAKIHAIDPEDRTFTRENVENRLNAGSAKLVEVLLINTDWLEDNITLGFKADNDHIGNFIYHVPATSLGGTNVYKFAAQLVREDCEILAYTCETAAQARNGEGANKRRSIAGEQKRFPKAGDNYVKPKYFFVRSIEALAIVRSPTLKAV